MAREVSCCRAMLVHLEPDVITHLDRDFPHVAAPGVRWAVLEFLLVAASDGAVVSSGYGLMAADVGGLTPQVTLLLKSVEGRQRCLPAGTAPTLKI